MRAIGKGSLASILAVGLNFTRIFLWIGFVGLSIAMVVVPLLSVIAELVQDVDGVNLDADISAGRDDYLELAHHFVNFGVMLFVVNRLLEILKTLRFGSPFVRENADRFRGVGYALLIGQAAVIAFGFLSLIFDADIEIDMSPIAWLAIIAVFVLSEVFREGARMKEEQDLTV